MPPGLPNRFRPGLKVEPRPGDAIPVSPALRVGGRIRWRIVTLLGDLVAIAGGFFLAHWLRYELRLGPDLTEFQFTPLGEYWPVGVTFIAVMLLALHFYGSYGNRRSIHWLDEVPKVGMAALLATAAVIIVFFLFRPAFFSRLMFGYLLLAGFGLTAFWRFALRALRIARFRRGRDVERVVVVGRGNMAKMLMQQLTAAPASGLQLVGFVDHEPDNGEDFGRFRRLGGPDHLGAALRDAGANRAVVALPPSSSLAVSDAVSACRSSGVQCTIVPDLADVQAGRLHTEEIAGIPLFTLSTNEIAGFNYLQKRVLDTLLAALLLAVLSPLLLVIIIAIKLDSRGPILFRQVRVGRNGREFQLHKFRSMVPEAERMMEELYPGSSAEPLFKRRDDPRRTRVGRLLRRTSLDELPQMFNVITGDMSMVGPRAQVPDEVAQYDDWAHTRLRVLPGLTGLWQVSGRSNLSFEEMVMLDTYYVGHWSLGLDIKIILRTIPAVIRGEGAY